MNFLAQLGFFMAALMVLFISEIVERKTGFNADFFIGWMACRFYSEIFERRTR
ncbi:hypothetical protein [Methylocystis sp.]|uniref:hypothetical protein n=1 Tax=Methylocystis sp. TaxID=1911079 RepID=UPI002732D46C|nr:hypothetical protein [Methylocystis sp.]MDP3554849.1 hypothetical protein [Methylocystis sp.]